MSEAELRAMVREVLREALSKRAVPAGQAAPPTIESVSITSDSELAAFVRRLIQLLEDPAAGAALRSGRHSFSLAGGAPGAPATTTTAPAVSHATAAGQSVLVTGTVTEAKINKCAGAAAIVLAPGAVITPLARDRARALGLRIERKR